MKARLFSVKLDMLISFLLIATIFMAFWQVRNHDFITFDDNAYVADNPHVRAGLTREGVIWAFTSGYASNWHPLTWLSHMLDCEIYGLNAGGHHLTNLAFHLTNILLLFLLLKGVTGALWRSAFVAALFGLHPLHVESVAWVAERKDVLSTFFWMLTMWAYIRYVQSWRFRTYLLTVVFFAFGLMAKPMLVTLPFVLLLLDYWPLGRFQPGRSAAGPATPLQASAEPDNQRALALRLVWEKVPFFVLAGASSVVTFLVQKSGGAVGSLEGYPVALRIANALVSYVRYLGKMIWPHKLAVFYPHPGNSLPEWQPVLAGVLLLAVSVAVLRLSRRHPYLAVGWLWYLGTLVPVIGLVQVGGQAMADRYTYVPLIGLFIMIAWGVPNLLAGWRYRRVALTLATGAVIPALMICTWQQIHYWQNSTTLFEHALRVTEGNYVAHNNLGIALARQGDFEKASRRYRLALQIRPNYAEAYCNLGNAQARQGNLGEALSSFTRALQIKPDFPETHNSLGLVLERLGETEKAASHYAEALRLKPDWLEAHNNLGNLYVARGKFDAALDHYSQALRIDPRHAETHSNLAVALMQMGKIEQATAHYRKALALRPQSAEAHNNLAVLLVATGKLQEAISHYRKAVQIKPGYAEAHNNLGNALSELGKPKLAIVHFSRALELRPNYPEAHNNLGVALARQGNISEAIQHFKEALRLKAGYSQARANLRLALEEMGSE